jgi:hypothetical protein
MRGRRGVDPSPGRASSVGALAGRAGGRDYCSEYDEVDAAAGALSSGLGARLAAPCRWGSRGTGRASSGGCAQRLIGAEALGAALLTAGAAGDAGEAMGAGSTQGAGMAATIDAASGSADLPA